jgi:hypothetical protein
MLARFADPAQRRRIVAEAEEAMRARFGGPEGVYATGHQVELVDAMRTFGTMSAGEALLRLLEQRDGGAILRFGIESDLIAILRHPTASVACDCGAVTGRATHPRYYGTWPRVLGRYVREQQVLSWEEAIRKMTGLPAATMGLVNRGGLAPGMLADIVVFDPATIIDHATFERPTAMPDGITHVVVNGVVAWRDGRPTGATAGRVLVRGRHEPSRPQAMDERVRISGRARSDEIDLTIDLTFTPGEHQSRGTMQLTDRATGRSVSAADMGPVQVADRWVAVTMTTRAAEATAGAATLVFESTETTGTPSTTMTMTDAEGQVAVYTLPGTGIRVSRAPR